jgi:3-oxoacyl-[acyl-carrier-protein] synthase II
MNRRVVVTGMGLITPLGNSAPETWKGLVEGRSGIGPITLFDASSFPTRIAGEVKNIPAARWRAQYGPVMRNSIFALEAASEAMRDAGLAPGAVPSARLGIYFGAGDSGFDFETHAHVLTASTGSDESVDPAQFAEQARRTADPKAVLEQEPFQVINHLAEEFRADGVISNCLTACAASSQAVGEAMEIIRRGDADVMISGGAHSMIHPLGLAGFNLLTALSTRNDAPEKASRPFDRSRDGFVLSEGGAVLILESLDHAKARGARILAELSGYGGTADAYRMTDPHAEGRGAIRAIRMALADAGLSSVDAINAHGTSTQLNDSAETAAIKAVFGEKAKSIPVSSNKSMLGHMIAAAGAAELIVSVLTIRNGVIPPTINYENPDEACDLDYVPNRARAQKVSTVLSNSFGFGGQNIALVVRRYD